MNKTDIIDRISERADISKAAAKLAWEAIEEGVTDALVKGDTVVIPGFGTWRVSHRAARTGRNPQTGQPLQIAAANVPVFKAGKTLKDAVNNKE